MARIEKTKNGTYKSRVYLGRDNIGKTVHKTVYGNTKRDVEKEASALRAEFAKMPGERRLGEAIHTYVNSRNDSSIYSPTTYSGYASNLRTLQNYVPDYMAHDMWSLSSDDIEDMFRKLSARGLSAKSLKNIRGLISGSYKMAGGTMPDLTDMTRRMMRPQRQQTIAVDDAEDDDLYEGKYFPSKQDIQGVIRYASQHRPDLVIPICLAAYCGLRRSEICGLRIEKDFDMDRGTVTVSRAMVKDSNGQYVYKSTKTAGSVRTVPVPSVLMDRIIDAGTIYDKTPKSISDAWEHVVAGAVRAGLSGGIFTFHALRHFAAAWWMTDLHFDITTCMDLGGWTSQRTLLNIYAYVLSDAKANAHANINAVGNSMLIDAGM